MELEELDRAYRRTRYWANADGTWLGLMVGRADPLLDRLLERRRHEAWAYLTAWNPGSTARPRAENLVAQRALEDRVRKAGFELWVGQAIGPPVGNERWIEPSVLVLGMAGNVALDLARDFEQVAIVIGRRGAAPELVWC